MHSLPYRYSYFSKQMYAVCIFNKVKFLACFSTANVHQIICMFLHSATNPMVKFLQGSAEVLVQKPNIHSGALELVLQISAAGLSSHGTAGGWSIFCF